MDWVLYLGLIMIAMVLLYAAWWYLDYCADRRMSEQVPVLTKDIFKR